MIKSITVSITEQQFDPLRTVCRTVRCVDDAKLFILNRLCNHLEKPHTHTRILFRFSLAFNRILAQKLIADFHPNDQLIAWIIEFLSSHPQSVSVNGHLSSVTVTNTGYITGIFNIMTTVEVAMAIDC